MGSICPTPSGYPAEIIGYAQPWIVDPGDQVEIKVSCTEPEFKYRIVRVLQGTQCLNGPQQRSEEIHGIPAGVCPGRFQLAHPGSHAVISDIGLDELIDDGVRLIFYVQPWLTKCDHMQALVSTLNPSTRSGVAVVLNTRGTLDILVGQADKVQRIMSGFSPAHRRWTKIDLTVCRELLNLHITPLVHTLEPAGKPISLQVSLDRPLSVSSSTQLHLAASQSEEQLDGIPRVRPSNYFNGRLDTVTVEAVGERPRRLACYDFSVDIPSDQIIDTTGNNRTGILVNAPSRAVKGFRWDGAETDWTKSPRGYGAIHFHEDDLDDADWDTDFSIKVPADARSGVYAVEIEITASTVSDQVVFFVRPSEKANSQKEPKVALVMSTFTYLAYANEHQFDIDSPARAEIPGGLESLEFYKDETFGKQDRRRDLGLSCYDVHKDRSAVMYSSAKRPLLNCRPNYINWTGHRPRELSAELIMQGFLERLEVPYDVVTDHDLHMNGVQALHCYSAVITGCHPEYHTLESYRAYEEYLRGGGNLMYMGGNGFYWSSALDRLRPHRLEVRRGGQGVRTSYQEPGERHHAIDGHVGGLWRDRGRAANYLVGIGCCGEGAGPGVPYRMKSGVRAAYPNITSWIFEQLPTHDELVFGENALGGFGGGASADEIDRMDIGYGSPANAIILASSTGHPDTFGLFPEDSGFPMTKTLGTQTDSIRSDMVYWETCGGGSVFSVGSISWYCALGWNDFRNDIAVITENVLRKLGKIQGTNGGA